MLLMCNVNVPAWTLIHDFSARCNSPFLPPLWNLPRVAVTVAFIICWAPFHTQRLMVLYVNSWTPEMLAAQSHIFYVSGVLYFVSSTVNPILYNVISRRYRVAFKQTICGPCRQHRSRRFFSRQSLGSNVTNRQIGKRGEQVFLQQHHSLLDKETPQVDLRGQRHPCPRCNVCESRGNDARRCGCASRSLGPGLCPGILRRKQRERDGAYSTAVETRCSLEDLSQHNHHYFQLKVIPTVRRRTNADDPFSENLCDSSPHPTHHQPDPKSLPLADKPKEYQVCNSEDGGGRATSRDKTLSQAIFNVAETDTHPSNTRRRNDSNDNPYNPKTNNEESLERSYGTKVASTGEKCVSSAHSSSHQHSVSRESASSSSLCKQCITNICPAVNGATPYADVDAYHVGFDVSKPHTHL